MTQVKRRFESTGESTRAAEETIREAREMARTEKVQQILMTPQGEVPPEEDSAPPPQD